MKNNKNKNVIRLVLAFFITIVIMFAYNFILEYNESKNSYRIKKDDKLLTIKYTLVDKNKVPEGSSIDDLWASHFDALYNIIIDDVVLQKENDYYVVDLNYTNDAITKDITDVDFAMNNDLGQVLDDCKFDKENLKIYIPTKYYKEYNNSVQTQIMSRIDSEQLAVNYKKGNQTRNVVGDVYDNVLKIPIVNTEAKGYKLNRDDITLYINGKKFYLDDSNSKYLKNGSLDLNMNAALVDSIEVKVNKSNFAKKFAEKVFVATVVKASGVSGYDFAGNNYASIGNLRKSDIIINQIQEDDVWYIKNNGINYNVRVTQNDNVALSQFLTNCNNKTSNMTQFETCIQTPFDNKLTSDGGNAKGEGSITSKDQAINTYCPSFATEWFNAQQHAEQYRTELEARFTNYCTTYYTRVYNCIDRYGSSNNQKKMCKEFAYFDGSDNVNNYNNLKNAFQGFIHSSPYLIFKRTLDGTTDITTTDQAHYTNDLYMYVMRNDLTKPTVGDDIAKDKQSNVIQWIRLPQSGVPTINDDIRVSKNAIFPLDIYYSMKQYDGYVASACGHINTSAYTNVSSNIALGVRIAKQTNDYMVIAFATQPARAGQGDAQATYALYKFDIFDDTKTKLRLTKSYVGNESSTPTGNETFKVYEATKNGDTWTCGNQVGSKMSYSNGQFVKDDELLVDKSYCVIETVDSNDYNVKYYNSTGTTDITKNVVLNGNTVKGAIVTYNASDPTEGGYYIQSIIAENTRRKYCYAVKKVDAENNSLALKSGGEEDNKKFTFTSNGVTLSTTTSSNIVVFGPVPYGSYSVREKNISEGVTSDQGIYWTNAPSVTISTSDLVEAEIVDGQHKCKAATTSKAINMPDNKHYYCVRVQKVDASNGNVPLAGAKFTSPSLTGYNEAGTANGETLSDNGKHGYYYFFTGNNPQSISITESQVPNGYYANELTKTATPVLMANTVTANTSIANQIAACNTAYENKTTTVFNNYRYLLNWFKVDENDTKANGAKFIVQNSEGKYLKLGAVQPQSDKDGHDKKCYPLTGTTTNINEATVVVSQDVGVHSTAKDGEACIMGLNPGNYTVIETDSIESHTIGSVDRRTIAANESYQSKTTNNTFVNYPTRVELEKESTSPDEYTNSELSKIEFVLYRTDANGNPIGEPITLDDLGNGLYDYISQTSQTSSLHVNGEAKLEITHLPKDKYILMENQSDTCEDSTDPTKCIGYYMPTGSENGQRFTITKCSSDEAAGCGIGEYGKEVVTAWNTPTEIDFTELDYYRIYDQEDIAIEGNTVDGIYSTQMERSDFDRMIFTLYDKDDTPVSLQFVRNHGDCTSDEDYAEYRYVIGGEATGVTDLHTCGGHLRITHLCRGASYTIKEKSVAENSVFVYEDTQSTPMEKDYKIACKPDDPRPPVTETNLIENKPTRVVFEKRDAKYRYLIPDETTTFEVYRCPSNEECHPGDYTTVEAREAAGMELVKFYSRAVIPGDEEDPGIEVYKMMSYSDAQNRAKCEGNNTNNCYVTSINPAGGKIIFRYLAAGYNYVLLETVAPKNYLLPAGRLAENTFTVRTDTVSVEEIKVPNQPTGLLIRKYDDEGRLLGGAKFKVSEVINYNPNKKAQEQELVGLKFKTIKQGVYEYRPVLDSDLVITCEGSSCNDTDSFSFDRDWSNFDSLLTSSGETIKDVLTEGTAIVQYLEYGKYYVIEEVEAPKGHSLPDGDGRYTLIHIGENTSVIEDTEDVFVNYPTSFTFYKFDEYNNLIDGAKFKLQKLNDNKSYITLNVTKVEGEDSLYKVDNTSTNDIIETTNGKATVYYLEEGQYRVVEVQAPDGKELPKKTLNVATFFVDKDGNVFGENIIANKAPTEKKVVKPEAKASLLINIQTGQNVVKYGLIIAILVAAITGLMIFMKKRK